MLVFGEKATGRESVNFYTLIRNCRVHQIGLARYFPDIFERLSYETNQTVDQLASAALAQKTPRSANLAELTTSSKPVSNTRLSGW